MSLPHFDKAVIMAYDAMNSQDSASDYFVAGFADELELVVKAQGKGGLKAVKEVLTRDFDASIAVAMFRVTAVDARGTTTSLRTKLVHIIYIGPHTPVMQRAKVASYNKTLKEPFTCNLALQSDNAEELTEERIEKALRASGGAHQPTSFDFANESTGASGNVTPPSPSGGGSGGDAPASPSKLVTAATTTPPSPDFLTEFLKSHKEAIMAKNIDMAIAAYTPESVMFHTRVVNTEEGSNTALEMQRGIQDISKFYEMLFELVTETQTAEGEVPLSPEHTILFGPDEVVGADAVALSWSCPTQGLTLTTETIVFNMATGKVSHHIVTSIASPHQLIEDQMSRLMAGFSHIFGEGGAAMGMMDEDALEELMHQHSHSHGGGGEGDDEHHHHGHSHGMQFEMAEDDDDHHESEEQHQHTTGQESTGVVIEMVEEGGSEEVEGAEHDMEATD